jgi:hypothetical protein
MEGKPVYTLDYNGNRAFADITYEAKPNTLFVNYLASTGGGSGTELLTQIAERASSKGLALEWVEYYNIELIVPEHRKLYDERLKRKNQQRS